MDLSTFFECPKPFENYGGKDARIRVIPVVRENRQDYENGVFINCTSSGEGAEQDLSPFNLGPCRLYANHTAQIMENGWQFSKVYPQQVDGTGQPTPEYFEWAEKGWATQRANRHPMGKEMNRKEAFHWWNGEPLAKVQARKRIYVPLYVEQVIKMDMFSVLKNTWEEQVEPDADATLYLMDFGTRPYGNRSLTDVLNNPKYSMGHGFVLAMLLTNDAALRECELRQP